MLTSEKKKKPYLVLLKPKMSNSFPPQNKLSSLELSVTYKICFFFPAFWAHIKEKSFFACPDSAGPDSHYPALLAAGLAQAMTGREVCHLPQKWKQEEWKEKKPPYFIITAEPP